MPCGDSPLPGLVGIAKLAAEGEVLEAKRVVRYLEIGCKSVLNRLRPGSPSDTGKPYTLPFQWTINPYRGCEFACRYCYARYTHEFMELRDPADFEDRIFVKSDVAALLSKELRRMWPAGGIGMGTATDPYQPAERRYGRTREVLEVLAGQRGLSLYITTKSDLIVRDIPLLKEFAERNTLSVNLTITTLDESLARKLEPRAPRPILRLKTVRKLADAGIHVGVLPNPIMPMITDQDERLDRLAKASRDHGAQYFGGGILFLQPCSRRVFLPFVEQHYPRLLKRYMDRYENDAFLRGGYRDMIRERLTRIRSKYGLDNPVAPPAPAPRQPALFDYAPLAA